MSASEGELEIAEIIGERKTSKRGLEYLVRWQGFDSSSNSWEPLKNLANAAKAIADFRAKSLTQRKSKKSSKSRSRSRSSSRGRSSKRSKSKESRSKSKTSSPGRRSSSRSRKSETTTTTTTSVSTPSTVETKTETVTQSPGHTEKTTETLTRSVLTPSLTQRSTVVSRTTEVRTTTSSDATQPPKAQGWCQMCCAPFQKVRDCCRGLVRSDYPAIVAFATISIIMLTFVLERTVDFSKLSETVMAFFLAIWEWLASIPGKVTALMGSKSA